MTVHATRACARLTLIGVGALLTACSGESTGPAAGTPGTPGVSLVSQTVLTDTIEAFVPEPVTLLVRDPAGKPAVRTPVRFSPSFTPRDPQVSASDVQHLRLCRDEVARCDFASSRVLDTTDATGQVQLRVRLGPRSGPALLRVEVPDYGYADSVVFTVRPGAPAKILKTSADTGIAIGESAGIAARLTDRTGNVIAGQLPQISGLTLGQLDAQTGVVTGTTFGTEWVRFTFESIADSMRLRIVPPARLVAYNLQDAQFAMLDVTGRNVRTLTGLGPLYTQYALAPRFDASRRGVMLVRGATGGGSGPYLLTVADTATVATRAPGTFAMILGMRAMADGTVLVVSATDFLDFIAFSPTFTLSRVAVDGTVTPVAVLSGFPRMIGGIDISPDGRKLVYGGERNDGLLLEVMDVATNAVTVVASGAGLRPLWSPSGDQIAYLASSASSPAVIANPALMVVRPDGTGRRQLAAGEFTPLAWSPSGEYLLVRPQGFVQVMRVSDGVAVQANVAVSSYSLFDWR